MASGFLEGHYLQEQNSFNTFKHAHTRNHWHFNSSFLQKIHYVVFISSIDLLKSQIVPLSVHIWTCQKQGGIMYIGFKFRNGYERYIFSCIYIVWRKFFLCFLFFQNNAQQTIVVKPVGFGCCRFHSAMLIWSFLNWHKLGI